MDNRYGKLAFQIFTLACVIAIGVCLICDFVLNKGMTWSWYPITALPFTWVVAAPLLLAKRNKPIFSLIALTIAILPFLYLLERHTPVKGWFMALGVPVTVMSLAAVWLMFFLVRIIKNKWYLSAIAVFLFSVVVATVARYFVSRYTGDSFLSLDNAINLLSGVAITALLVIIGNNKRRNGNVENLDSEKLQ